MSDAVAADVAELSRLFHAEIGELGRFEPVTADELPLVYRQLLAHEHHMTVTVEAYHRSPVDVQILGRQNTPLYYAREILLVRRTDGRVVQHGIMRLAKASLAPHVRAEVEREASPLGHILIRHDVLRSIRLRQLYRVTPGAALTGWFGLEQPRITYGRTAQISADGEPSVELLEIVAPV